MSKTLPQLDISALPYPQRQLIVVQPDEIVAATRAAKTGPSSSNGVDWKKIAGAGVTVIGGPIAWTAAAVFLGKEAYDSWAKARESGLNVLLISDTEAAKLALPPGHPRRGTLYVAHPVIEGVYYTTASFHRLVFEHKFAEAVEILMSLGASHIEVEHVHGWSREFAATISSPIPPVTVEATMSSKASLSSSLLFKADFTSGKIPCLPEKLVWYSHEPTWQSFAKGRLNHEMREFSLVVNYQEDFGVNAGLRTKAEKAGLDLGGSFERHTGTTWKISATFGQSKA